MYASSDGEKDKSNSKNGRVLSSPALPWRDHANNFLLPSKSVLWVCNKYEVTQHVEKLLKINKPGICHPEIVLQVMKLSHLETLIHLYLQNQFCSIALTLFVCLVG